MAKKKVPSPPKVDRSVDSETDAQEIARAELVFDKTSQSPEFSQSQRLKDSVTEYRDAAVQLGATLAIYAKLKSDLDKAGGDVVDQRHALRQARRVASNDAEAVAASQQDLQRWGFSVQQRAPRQPAAEPPPAPSAIDFTQDFKKNRLNAHVKWENGDPQPCQLQYTTEASGLTGWTDADGDGAKRTIASPPKGTMLFRARTVRARKYSDWFGPISTTVK